MGSSEHEKPSLKKLGPIRRKTINLSCEDVVRTGYLEPGREIPYLIQPIDSRLDAATWARNNQELISTLLLKHRALLFRGFEVATVADFKRLAVATSQGKLLEYNDRSSPRYEVENGIYVSTIYPADRRINLHNEGSYWLVWVMKIYFCCLNVPEQGGETPIADVRKVLARLSPSVIDRFKQKQVMYVRNYNDGFGLTWQEAFQTNDRAEAEAYCWKNEIEVEWKGDDRLRTRQVRPAIRQHPRTGEWVWFNHAAFFHILGQDSQIRKGLLETFSAEDLPYMTYYGDGASIEPSVIEEIKEAYQKEKVTFPWKEGDILLLDNMSVAHGRESYKGDRRVVVAMSEPHSGKDEFENLQEKP
jgi:alpha-ketoglutarate-dependent taurine dioxygenase